MGKSNETVNLVGAVLLGAVAGAALGILFAPDKGSETRNKLACGTRDLADDLKKRMRSEIKNLDEGALNLGESVEDKFENRSRNLKEHVDGLQQV